MSRRLRNWDYALHLYERDVVGRPFVWGETDCASVVVGAVRAMYPDGDAPLPPSTPRYGSETAALRAHRQTGGVAAALRAVGWEEVDLMHAQQGDVIIGLDPQGGVPGAAFVFAFHYVVASVDDGVVRRRLRHLREANPDGEGLTVLRSPDVADG